MQKRYEVLDEFRGLSMAQMIAFSPLFLFNCIPAWLKHSPDNGLYPADIVAPLFIFAMGMSYRLSFLRRREILSGPHLILSFLKHFSVLLLFGLLGEVARYGESKLHWGVLETIGASGIVVLPLMFCNYKIRLILAFVMPALWQIFSTGYPNLALTYDFGGPWSVPAWSGIILAGSVAIEFRAMGNAAFIRILEIAGAAILFLAAVATCFFPVSKTLVSFPYVLAGMCCSLLVFAAFVMKEAAGLPLRFLSVIGKNCFLLYVLAGFEYLIYVKIFPPTLALGWVLLASAGGFAILYFIALLLARKNIYLKI